MTTSSERSGHVKEHAAHSTTRACGQCSMIKRGSAHGLHTEQRVALEPRGKDVIKDLTFWLAGNPGRRCG
jgi:hypothetical protein